MESQHQKGKLTARERIAVLLDPGSFGEIDKFRLHDCHDFDMKEKSYYGDGVVTGFGTIEGTDVFVYAQDFTVLGGSLSRSHARKICKVMDMAADAGAPIIGLNDSGGARVQEGIDALAGYGEIFLRNVRYSGLIPQITAILGPCAGGAVYSPAVQDFVLMTRRTSHMFVTGPKVVKTVLHEDVTTADLGGAQVHGTVSGAAHIVKETEHEVIEEIRRLVCFLARKEVAEQSLPKKKEPVFKRPAKRESLWDIIPGDLRKPYNIRDVITQVIDIESMIEISQDFAKNIVTCFARIGGIGIGIIANQPNHFAGVLDIKASRKAARFIRFCDAFGVPIVTLEDVPGFMPGKDQEQNGIIVNGAKLLYAYAEATVPKLTVILRKAYGGAYIVMSSRHLLADMVFAWPHAEIAVMGAEGAVEVLYSKQAGSNGQVTEHEFRQQKIQEYSDFFLNPYRAAEKGYIDAIIDPDETRERLLGALRLFAAKQQVLPAKKHGNIPL